MPESTSLTIHGKKSNEKGKRLSLVSIQSRNNEEINAHLGRAVSCFISLND